MGHLVTRPAGLDDATRAIEVLRESITRLCIADHQNDPKTLELWLSNKTTEHFARWLANADSHIVVAELDSNVCGVAALTRAGKITLCYVHPSTLRRGIGRGLLAALEAQARLWGIRKLELNSSLTARAFYERHGYRSAGDPVPGLGVILGYPYEKELAP